MKTYEIKINNPTPNAKERALQTEIDRFGWHDANIELWNYSAGYTVTVKSNDDEIARFCEALKTSQVRKLD